jgi:hypothetical protein
MANDILIRTGTPITWKASGGTYAMTMASVANNAARQGVKGDLGAVRAARWSVQVENNLDSAPAAGKTLEYWWSSSPSVTAGTKNTGAASGTDAAYTGSTGGSVDETKLQLEWIGALVLTPDADAVVQSTEFSFYPKQRYGMPILVNKSGVALEGDDDSHLITFTPIIDEVQDSA